MEGVEGNEVILLQFLPVNFLRNAARICIFVHKNEYHELVQNKNRG